jgi:hypothetical protein
MFFASLNKLNFEGITSDLWTVTLEKVQNLFKGASTSKTKVEIINTSVSGKFRVKSKK